ncbi:MAG TPA: hypothetical protein PKO36_18905 [Candidatus Hydrogenedentes bacterium]|nr:hypothetical protein [Candidatus Hydrogenedentota bacterium]HOV75854.1 hypothetical protein [Candidatus Hydrogenedentota bacterium]
MNNRYAAAVATGLALASFALVYTFLGDGILQDGAVPEGREHRAALAIRDDVTPFQKWGTMLFTLRYLTRHYDHAWYFTQSRKDDKKEAFLAALDHALRRYRAVDLFLLAHTNQYVDWVKSLPDDHRRRLRLVYNTGCHNLPQGRHWLDLGAKIYVGHPGESTSPVFYFYFLRRWTHGDSIRKAVEESNILAWRKFRQVEAATFGRLNAESFVRESWASCRGDNHLRVEDFPE